MKKPTSKSTLPSTKTEIQKSILSVVNEMKSRKIKTDSDYNFATEWLKKNKSTQKIVNASFEDELRDAKSKLDAVKSNLNTFILPLVESEKSVKSQILTYQQEKQRLLEEAQEKLRIAEEKNRTSKTIDKYETAVAEVKSNLAPKISGISTRKNWTFSIIDETLIPREYLTPNLQLLGEIARNEKEKASIPGIEFLFTESLTVR